MPRIRLVQGLIALSILFPALSCQDFIDPVSPVEPQFAKGGKPGKPSDQPGVRLLEYYVYQDQSGDNYVHVLAEGSAPFVNLNVVQDYFFNGIRDDDYSIHYEYQTGAPLPVSVEDFGDVDIEAGTFHIDIPWNGETWWRDWSDPDNPMRVVTSFPDFPHVALDEAGSDPYAFDIRFQKENGDYIKGYQPQGIYLAGVDQEVPVLGGSAVGSLYHTVNQVYSYATVSSLKTTNLVYIDDMWLDRNSVTCEIKTVRERVNGVKITRKVTRVTGRARVVVRNHPGGPVSEAWLEVMFARSTGDPTSPEIADSFQSTHGAESWADEWGLSAEFDGAHTSLPLQLAVTYVYASDLEHQFVYDPSKNSYGGANIALDPWYTLNAGPISQLHTFPVALTQPVTVDCGK